MKLNRIYDGREAADVGGISSGPRLDSESRFRRLSGRESGDSGALVYDQTAGSVSSRSSLIAIVRAMQSTQIAVLAIFCLYAAFFIYRTSFVIGGTRYFCLFDDDMISMRYAANLAHGHGLVWNPGDERVQGFTNLLWVLYMAVLHLLPISAVKISALVQTTGALLLAVNLLFVVAVCNQLFPGRSTIALVAMVLTALAGPLNNWALQGTEVSALTLGVTASTWLTLRAIESKKLPLSLYVLLGILTLVRLDGALGALTIILVLTAIEPERWKAHLLLGGSILAAFLAAQLGFSFWYYGEALPNTYYLKMTGYPLIGRIRRGLLVSVVFLLPLIPLLLGIAARVVRRRLKRGELILAALVTVQLAYSIWVGGDAWEWWGGSNRYVSIVMPLFFILVSPALVGVSLRFARMAKNADGARRAEAIALTSMVYLAALMVNAYKLKNILLIEPPLQTARPQSVDTNEDMVRRALIIDQLTERDASIAVVWAGAIPYFADRYAIDLLGKNDPKIAHEKMHTESAVAQSRGFWPGHLKWDYDYSIGQLKPDVVVQVWGVEPETIPWLQRDYLPARFGGFLWYLKRGSPHIRWSTLDLQNRGAVAAE